MKAEDYFEKKKKENDKSFAFFIERCPHSDENPHGIRICSEISPDKPTVVLLPGTAEEKNMLHLCNGLLKKIDGFVFNIAHFEKKSVQVCAAVCHFGKYFNSGMARRLLYLFYKDYCSYTLQLHNFDEEEKREYIFPNYVMDIYEQLIVPRIYDKNQNLLPFNLALRRMQNLIVVTYCHGAYSWMKIEEQLNLLLSGHEYSSRQKKRLLKSVTVLAYSPDCPLGFSNTQFISLASASDLSIQHGNGFIRYVHRNLFVDDFGLSYLSGKMGKVFYCAQYSKGGVEGNPRVFKRVDPQIWYQNLHQRNEVPKKTYISEHDFLGFTSYSNMSKAALRLQQIGMFILANAIENSLSDKPKQLSVFSLVGGLKHNFWTCLKAMSKGFVILLKRLWWERKPHRYSFADNVNFVSMD